MGNRVARKTFAAQRGIIVRQPLVLRGRYAANKGREALLSGGCWAGG